MRITMHRGKWRLEGCFVEGYLCYTPSTNEIGLQTMETHGVVPVVPESVGEYTGRLDIKGKRIYEGDIVQYGAGLWVVEYNTGKMGFVFRNIRNDAILPGYAVTAAVTVVGNTIENPELLRTKRLTHGSRHNSGRK